MNISTKWISVILGLCMISSVQAFTFKFNNQTIRNLLIKIKVRNTPEDQIELPANGTVEKSYAATGFEGCTEYIKIRKPNGDVVAPKLLVVNEDKHAALMYRKEMKEPIDLSELFDFTYSSGYTGVFISPGTQVCANAVLDIFMDMNGDVLLVMKVQDMVE